jgi:hypothetical protein
MNSTAARERIYRNMDAMALELDALDNLMQVRKGITGYINKINSSIERGRRFNQLLETDTKQNKV